MENIFNYFSSKEEENKEIIEENQDPLVINPEEYEEMIIIQLLKINDYY